MAKKSKTLIPKRIGKVKVSKSVRKGALGDLLASKAGQALIAEAIMAAGALAGAKLMKSGKARKARKASAAGPVDTAGAKVGKAGEDAGATAAVFTYALGEAVRSFSNALHHSHNHHATGAEGPSWSPTVPTPARRKSRAKSPAPPAA